MTKLLIIESPNKIHKLEEILGPNWKIIASYGHVRDLPEKEIGVEAPDYRPQYVAKDRGAQQIAAITNAASTAEEIYLGTDPDREGESISWHIKTACGIKSYKRVKFNELTREHVLKRIKEAGSIDNQLVLAQETRRVLDRFVGYKVSPALSDMGGGKLSAGRVQSVALRLVVERELGIKYFKPTDHFTVKLNFDGWFAEWRTDHFVTKDAPYVLDSELASHVAAVKSATVKKYEEAKAKRSPPPPFITATLQQAASVALKMKTSVAMETAQKLFDKGLITYHRTDKPELSEEAIAAVFAYCDENDLPRAEKPRQFKARDSAQEGHEATRPTDFNVTDAGDTPQERALYKLIWQRAVASQMADAKYATRTVELSAGDVNGKPLVFEAKGRTLIEAGWLSLTKGDQTEKEEADVSNPIPKLTTGATLTPSGEVVPKKTRAPARLTDASLIKVLEEKGIGRPSTYSSIITTLLDREYVRQDDDMRLHALDLGVSVYQMLNTRFAFMDYEFTREMEERLDRIAEGKAKYVETVAEFDASLEKEIAGFMRSVKPRFPCPDCGRPLRRIESDGQGFFWGCAGYPNDCKTTRPDDNGKPGASAGPVLTAHKCKCGKPLVHLKRAASAGVKAYDFFGCSDRESCGNKYANKGGKPDYAAAMKNAPGVTVGKKPIRIGIANIKR